MSKVLYFVSHPIQYQSPLIKLFSRILKNRLEVIYLSDFSIGNFYENDFSSKIKWDIDLLGKHKYTILNKNQKNEYRYFRPFINYKFILRLIKEKPEFLMLHGWANINFLIIMIFSKLIGVKVLVRCENYIKINNIFKSLFKYIYYKFILFFPNYYLYIGKSNKKFYEKYGWNRKYIPFKYSVDNKYLKVQAKKEINGNLLKNIKKNKINFYFVGKLIKRKNPIIILKAINLIKNDFLDCNFYFIGDGNEKEKLQNFENEHGLKNIYYLGFQNTSEIPKIINLFDILICPSLEENWGLVVNESLALGKKVIVSSAVKSSEDLINSKNGKIFENDNVNDLSNSMLEIINSYKRDNINETLTIDDSFSFKSNIRNIINLNQNG